MWPVTTTTTDEPDTRSPTTKAEDECVALYEQLTPFKRATLLWLLNRDGWTCDKALAVRRRGVKP